ncbi:MAG: hypothetical protein KF752_07035 [Pirellulaceae bacterium]|nr:hypothetical protein [Pirellulaceae bacterium]
MSSFYPAITGRYSAPLAITRMLSQVHGDQAAVLKLQMQLSTGLRFQNPSQDLPAATKVMSAQRQLEFRAQTDVNLSSADNILSASESSLSQAHNILNEIRAVAVEGAGNTLSDDQRTALISQIDTSLRRLVDLANTKFGDQFIFGGSGVRNNPLELVGNSVRFSGNHEELNSIADYGTTLAANVTAHDAFGVQSSQVVGKIDLNPSLSMETPLAQLNQGAGVRTGAIRLSSGVESVEIDLANAYSLGDVIQRINQLSLGGRQVQATLLSHSLEIDFQDGLGGVLRIEDVGSGAMASDLGINNLDSNQSSPVQGSDLNVILTPTTRLWQLFGGAGLQPGESLRITQAGTNYVVNTNGMNTVEDLLNRLERTGARIKASIDSSGRYLVVQSTESGSDFSIGENGGTLATSLGLRSMTLDTPVSSLNHGAGIGINASGDDLIFTRNNGTQMRVNLTGVQTIGDVITRINENAANFNVGLQITASLETVGNGIRLTSPSGTQQISVTNAAGSTAAIGLGWATKDSVTSEGTTTGTNSVIHGRDVATVQVDGIYSSILSLRKAIDSNDPQAVLSLWPALERDLDRLSVARGLVGARQQSIENRLDKSAQQQLKLKEMESDYRDADLASVISELAQRQAAMQASLQLMGQTGRLSLFDFL